MTRTMTPTAKLSARRAANRAAKRPVTTKAEAARGADFKRRVRAAGLDRDDVDPAQDMDAFRSRLARLINLFVNNWHGCPQRICRRQRGCMAPNNTCANAPPRDPNDQSWRKGHARLMAAFKEIEAKREDGG